MKIVFMGTPDFAVPSLKAVVNSGHKVEAVVTNQDEPQGRGLTVSPPAVKTAALELGLQVIQVSSLKDPEFLEKLKSLSPDLMVVVAFRILPRDVYSIPKLGTFNLHASLLPKYRGAAPINWAIINGEKETGVTTFFLDDKVDTGKVILRKKIEIGENETAGELSSRLSFLGAEAVVETLIKIQSRRMEPRRARQFSVNESAEDHQGRLPYSLDEAGDNSSQFYPGIFTGPWCLHIPRS